MSHSPGIDTLECVLDGESASRSWNSTILEFADSRKEMREVGTKGAFFPAIQRFSASTPKKIGVATLTILQHGNNYRQSSYAVSKRSHFKHHGNGISVAH